MTMIEGTSMSIASRSETRALAITSAIRIAMTGRDESGKDSMVFLRSKRRSNRLNANVI
jgi:hypothetical protein